MFLELSSVLRGVTVFHMVFSWLWAEILKFCSGLIVNELIPYGLTAKSWFRTEHLLGQVCSSIQVLYSFLFERGLLWNKTRLFYSKLEVGFGGYVFYLSFFISFACYFLTNFSFLRRNYRKFVLTALCMVLVFKACCCLYFKNIFTACSMFGWVKLWHAFDLFSYVWM